MRRFALRTGDTVEGQIRSPKDGERYFALLKVNEHQLRSAGEDSRHRINFDNLTPLYPDEKIKLEVEDPTIKDMTHPGDRPGGADRQGSARVDRGAAAYAGKTMILQNVANSISAKNHPEIYLLVLLIDERPEEVTDMDRSVKGEVVSSTFDEPATRHVQVAEMVIEKAKRLVGAQEGRGDPASIPSPAWRGPTTPWCPVRARVLTGGVDANALQRPKRFFGAARNIEEGGSLTIISRPR